MNYEIVSFKEKTVVGVSARTSNNDPNMSQVIGGLWEKLYNGGIHTKIKNKSNQYAIGLYSDYCEDGYQIIVGNEVTKAENEDLIIKTIPAGKYAKFSVHGNMQTAVSEAWEKIWQMNLDRSFTGDFEEYLNADFENADINIYIALR